MMDSGHHPSGASRAPLGPAFRSDLEIERGSAFLGASTRDITANEMLIETADPLWVGAGFTAGLKLDCLADLSNPDEAWELPECRKRYPDLLSSLQQRLLRSSYTRHDDTLP